MRKLIGTTALIVTSGVVGYLLKSSNTDSSVLNANASSLINSNLQILLRLPDYKLPLKCDLKTYKNFIVSYNRSTKNPDWVLEVLTPSLVGMPDDNRDYRKNLCFEFDETEHPFFRSLPVDYTYSGFDRGHLAAAANYKNDETDCRRSFVMSNICPQVGENFNRGIWNKLEMYTRALVRRSEYVVVWTGPLYLPRTDGPKKFVHYEVIGESNVAVPTHFFKVLLVKEVRSDAFKLFSFILPNQALKTDADFSLFYVPVVDIERAAGFFICSHLTRGLNVRQSNGQHW